jgi:hypothetical protein
MKLIRDLKDLYPDYFWAVFGSKALEQYDLSQAFCNNKPRKLGWLKPKDIDVVTNASICSKAFKKLVGMLEDVVEVKQAHNGEYPIDVIKKRMEVVLADGTTYDFVFVRELTKASQWLDYQFSVFTQCLVEAPLDTTADGTIVSNKFKCVYHNGIKPNRVCWLDRHCTPGHREKVKKIQESLINY